MCKVVLRFPLLELEGGQQVGIQASHPTGRWHKTWGAIATGGQGDTGVSKQKLSIAGEPSLRIKKPATGGLMATGVSVSQKSKRAAEAAAIDGCVRRGGSKCEIRLSYHDQCAAVADPSPRSGGQAAGNSIVASAETFDEAQSLALN